MEQLLARLERRFGRYAIHNLISVVVGGMAIVWVLSLLKPEFQERLWLDIGAVRHGQVWRLVTFLFIPPPSKPMWVIINLYFTWWVGSSLEQRWGPFKFNVYYLLGALGNRDRCGDRRGRHEPVARRVALSRVRHRVSGRHHPALFHHPDPGQMARDRGRSPHGLRGRDAGVGRARVDRRGDGELFPLLR